MRGSFSTANSTALAAIPLRTPASIARDDA
jgi:hypothetical protein